MNYRSYNELSNLIKNNLYRLESQNFDLIVGIPRSGMIPAYMISLYLNKKCCDIRSLKKNELLTTGRTRKAKNDLTYPSEANKILLVDDSIWSGKSLANELDDIPQNIQSKITTLAIYSTKKDRNDVDLFFEYLPLPRAFEWNIFHNGIIENSCFDIDGVLCVDPIEEQNDDGEKYREFILNAEPLFIPSTKIKYLVTSRLEKYRPETETWLTKNGIRYDSLIMLDLPSKEERLRLGNHAEHKANSYKKSNSALFFESDKYQAIRIFELTKKPVYCVQTNEMYSKGNFVSSIHGSNTSKKMIIVNLLEKLPTPISNNIRKWVRKIKKQNTRNRK